MHTNILEPSSGNSTSGKLHILKNTFIHTNIPEPSSGIIAGIISAVLAAVLVVVALISVCIGIKYYRKANQ